MTLTLFAASVSLRRVAKLGVRFASLIAAGAVFWSPAVPTANGGTLFVSESSALRNNDSILKLTALGTRTTFAAGLSFARDLVFDNAGRLFAVDSGSGSIF